MTDNEIIKALECCPKATTMGDCEELGCPALKKGGCYYACCSDEDAFGDLLMTDVLSLINRQKAELDDLKRDDLPRCKDALRRANEMGMALEKENKELRAEVEKLELLNAILLESCNGYSKACDTYKAEIERLDEDNIAMESEVCRMDVELDGMIKQIKGIRSETVKKFTDMLKDQFDRYGVDYTAYAIVDNVAKKMEVDPK